MKPLHNYLRTGAVIASLLGASAIPALAGASPAVAATAFGSGAAVQKNVQAAWLAGWTPPSGDSITYTATTNGAGLAEFGNGGTALTPAQDSTANPVLDGYVAVDNPVVPSQVSSADSAGGTGTNEDTIPVGQVSEVIELHPPSGLTLGSSANIDLTNELADQLFDGTVPANSPYAVNTWGALLKDAGVTFTDDNSAGNTAITLQLRSDGAGATQVLKQYLQAVGAALGVTDWSSITPDENTEASTDWPSAGWAEKAGTFASSDSVEASDVASNAGYAGYGTLGAALTAGFGPTPGSSNLLYAFVQDNGVATKGARYADPEDAATTGSNVYSGESINTSGTYSPGSQSGAGNWLVPLTGTKFNTTGAWAVNPVNSSNPSQYSHAWDYDVYDDVADGNDYYPLAIGLWDLSWDHGSFGSGNLVSPLYPTPTGTHSVEETVSSYFKYVTSSSGQAATVAAHFAPLPTAVQVYAADVAAAL